jgi:hypothetical protein
MNPGERPSGGPPAGVDAARRGPDLEDPILEPVVVRGRRTARFNVRFGFAGVAALVLVVLLVSLGLSLGSNGRVGSEESSSPLVSTSAVASTTADQTASSPAPVGLLAHFDSDGLAFDYPASWQTSVSGLNMHYITILEFIGTGSGLATCEAITPGPSDLFISGSQCGTNLKVGPGQIVVQLSRADGPPSPPIDPSDPRGISAGGAYVTVGGLPAIYDEGPPTDPQASSGSLLALDWTLSVPERPNGRYLIHVEMKGPGVERMRAQVEALIASVRYDPPIPALSPTDGPRIAAIGLAQARSNEAALACFPSVPGTSATATVTELPGYSALSKPLPVTCATEIQPAAIGLWKLTLTESWTAASDRSAGSVMTTIWLAPDGTPGTTDSGPVGSSTIPYQQ